MELFRRLTTGKLSEISGEASLDSDKHYKIIGLHRIEKRRAKNLEFKSDSKIYRWLSSYIRGVNIGFLRSENNLRLNF